MSSGRLGPPSRAPSCRRRRNDASPPGPDTRSTALPMIARSSASQARADSGPDAARAWPPPPGAAAAAVGLSAVPPLARAAGLSAAIAPAGAIIGAGVTDGAAVTEPVQLDAQPDQVLQGVRVHLPGHDRGHRRITGHRRRGVAVQPRPAVTAARRGLRPARRPRGADPAGPLLLQRGAAVQHHQVRQRDMRPGLDRLPGPLRQQPRGDQPLQRLVQRIVVPLGLAAVILRPGRGRQRIQHRAHDRRALRASGPRSARPRPGRWSPASPTGPRTPRSRSWPGSSGRDRA